MVEQVNALSLLKEEMSTDEIHLKVNAIHRLKTVIMSIGPQESTAQLIPYLNSKLTGVTHLFYPLRVSLMRFFEIC